MGWLLTKLSFKCSKLRNRYARSRQCERYASLCMYLLVCWWLAHVTTSIRAGMVDPSIDEFGEPFCYFVKPTEQLGVMDGREGTQVTPEGWLYTGYAELMFFIGEPLKPLCKRVRTLHRGWLPIIEYAVVDNGIKYAIQMFATTLDGRPESRLINFVQVRVQNCSDESRMGRFAIAMRFGGADHRCKSLQKLCFNPDWTYEMRHIEPPANASQFPAQGIVVRDGQLIYTYPLKPPPSEWVSIGQAYVEPFRGSEQFILPTTPTCMVAYRMDLQPQQSQVLIFKFPYEPLPLHGIYRNELLQLLRADYDSHLQRTVHFWETLLARHTVIQLPERKVVDTYRASLVNNFIARDKLGKYYIVKVNELQYDAFWIRDGSYIVRTFDLYGYHEEAEQSLDYFLRYQQPDGIIYQPPQLDGWGQSLWAFGQHFKITGDVDWARRIYPRLKRAVRGILAECARDPYGVVPPTTAYDNEAIEGRYTGHNFWVLCGIRLIADMARALGRLNDFREFMVGYERLRKAFLRRLHEVAKITGGYIPPGLDVRGGCDWGNLIGVYPCMVLEPYDPLVTATWYRVRQAKFAEGLMTYCEALPGRWLHHYLTENVTQTSIIRGEQKDALNDLYAMLVHTSATHVGFETKITPWDNRDYGDNYPPHACFAAKYCAVLRNMLIREWRDELHLFSCLSPAWVKPGSVIAIRNAPTDFGTLTATMQCTDYGAVISINARWRNPPRNLIIHFPWFVQVRRLIADGRTIALPSPTPFQPALLEPPLPARVIAVNLLATTRSVIAHWEWDNNVTASLSYANAVNAWQDEYRNRYRTYVTAGYEPEPILIEAFARSFEERKRRWYEMLEQCGIATFKPVRASNTVPNSTPAFITDGDVSSRAPCWVSYPYPQWVQIDLLRVELIDRVQVFPYCRDRRRYYRYIVEVSEDGNEWDLVGDASSNIQPSPVDGVTFKFAPRRARYVRVTMLYNSANKAVHLREVRVFRASVFK